MNPARSRQAATRFGLLVSFASVALALSNPLAAQSACTSDSYRVIARRWDAVLRMAWELRQDCAHPERPAYTVRASSSAPIPPHDLFNARPQASPLTGPLLIHAGDPVRLWQQDARVRIEMSGIAEQSARSGERVVVRITRQTEDAGLNVERLSGIVRSAGDVEMER